MWQITSIKANNFFSYKDLDYNIVNNSLTMIYGTNKDLNAKRSNGSGKSVILDAITFAITGDCLRKVKTIKEIISNNEESCFAEIEMQNNVLDKTLKIRRYLHLKKSQKVEIFINGKLQNQLIDLKPSVSNDFIEEELGISFDDLLNYYLISKFSYQSLFLANDATKKEVINRFSKADFIDNVFPLIDKDIKEDQGKINQLEKSLVECSTKIILFEEQIEDLLNEDSYEKKSEKIQIIQLKIDTENDKILDCEEAIKKLETSKLEFEDKVKTYKKTFIKETEIVALKNNIDSLNKDVEKKRDDYSKIIFNYKGDFVVIEAKESENKKLITQYEKEIDGFHKEAVQLEKYISGEIECPKCKHHFILADSDFDVEAAKKEVKLFEKEKQKSEKLLSEQRVVRNKLREEIEAIDLKIKEDQNKSTEEANKIKKRIDELERLRTEKIRENTKIQGLIDNCNANIARNMQDMQFKRKTIDNTQETIKSFEAQILNVREENKVAEIAIINDKIVLEESKMKKIMDDTDILQVELAQKNEWYQRFKSFKSFLANKSLETIESQANFYLEKMGVELLVSIDGFRELSNKKTKEEITIELSRDNGITSETFGKFSGGEKACADISSILSMQNIINMTSKTGGLNFLACDEVLESVDAEGLNSVINGLNKLNKTIMIIAHSNANENIDFNKVVVEKEFGISKLLLN